MENKGSIDYSIKKAIDFLHEQHYGRYIESWHIYSNLDIGPFIGDVFQKSIITDSLIDACIAGYIVDKTHIDQNIKEIVSSASDLGWRYFPNWSELPYDADTLGHVLQVISKRNLSGSLMTCERAIDLLMKNHFDDGSFNTWLLDNRNLHDDMNRALGGGRDPEVIANVLYGLYLYDNRRFKQVIIKGVRYLVFQQNDLGAWPSTWYLGNYYGTFVCMRIIQKIMPSCASIIKAIRFLVESQARDGSWNNEPIHSAFAVLALSCCNVIPQYNWIYSKAISYLTGQQSREGWWEAGSYVKMINPNDRNVPIRYSSKIITTAYCIKALVKIKLLLMTPKEK